MKIALILLLCYSDMLYMFRSISLSEDLTNSRSIDYESYVTGPWSSILQEEVTSMRMTLHDHGLLIIGMGLPESDHRYQLGN